MTGCFDILHMGHITAFREAKKFVDYLVIGLENDQTIKISKGEDRPLNKIDQRMELVSELRSIDLVFEITDVVDYHDVPQEIHPVYLSVTSRLSPDVLFCSSVADSFWKEKENRAQALGIDFFDLVFPSRVTSSTDLKNRGAIKMLNEL